MRDLKTTNGVITVVQEHRFQIRQEDGQHRLFVLAHDAAQGWSDLQALKDAQSTITVYYSESETTAAAAHDVWKH